MMFDNLSSPEKVYENVRLSLKNFDPDRDDGIFSFRIGDLSTSYYVPLEDNKVAYIGENSVTVNHSLSADRLYEAALENMNREIVLKYLTDTTAELADLKSADQAAQEQIEADLRSDNVRDVIVLTNSSLQNGAAGILCSSWKDACHEDMIMLPSSRHEVLLFPYHGQDLRFFQKMVEEVNQTCVKPQDYLSDSVYLYDHLSQNLSLACDKFGLVPICQDTTFSIAESAAPVLK